MVLQQVRREETLTQRAQQQLEEIIVSGRMKAGSRLPSESDMATMLNVSRTVVREAVRLLSAKGLVDVRTGSGVYVRELNGSMVRDPIELLLRHRAISIEEIIEVRALVEVQLAGLAAERARPADIQALEDSIAALSRPGLSPSDYTRLDVAFHARLAAAGRNALFVILSETINMVMASRIESEYRENPEAPQDAIREHTAILNCVRVGDVQGARKAMADSLAKAPDHWRAYSGQDNPLLKRIGLESAKTRRRARPKLSTGV
jgi:GntR family transcriptional repressor for pyruvate dehydrogenase complex